MDKTKGPRAAGPLLVRQSALRSAELVLVRGLEPRTY
jgi:hypothetical protein